MRKIIFYVNLFKADVALEFDQCYQNWSYASLKDLPWIDFKQESMLKDFTESRNMCKLFPLYTLIFLAPVPEQRSWL